METSFLTGQLLIAMPGIGDPRFERALILVCAHDDQGAMGIAVNRPVEGLSVRALLERLEMAPAAALGEDLVRLGGPVDVERGFVVHTPDYHAEGGLAVAGGYQLSTTRDVLAVLGGPAAPRRAILALGYAGWDAGQLEQEIRQNVWLTAPADEDLVFGADSDTKWARALAKLGVDAQFLAADAGRA